MAEPGLVITRGHVDQGEPDLYLAGRLIDDTHALFNEKMTELQPLAGETIYVDLAELEYIDSRGLGSLLSWHLQCRKTAKHVKFLNVTAPVMRVLKACKLDEQLELDSGHQVRGGEGTNDTQFSIPGYAKAARLLVKLAEAIIVLDAKGRVVAANPACAKLLRAASTEELIGKFFPEAARLCDAEGFELSDEQYPLQLTSRVGRESFREDCFLAGPEGEPTPICIVATPLLEQEEVTGAVVELLDRSSQQRATSERAQREELTEGMEVVGKLCHELVQPLHASSGYMQMVMLEIDEDNPVYTKIRIVSEQLERVVEVAQNLQDTARGYRGMRKNNTGLKTD
ncbi:STAS domain-containing protein [Candidatus Sumerlaeota bacterium]